jgi:hypothetical protein
MVLHYGLDYNTFCAEVLTPNLLQGLSNMFHIFQCFEEGLLSCNFPVGDLPIYQFIQRCLCFWPIAGQSRSFSYILADAVQSITTRFNQDQPINYYYNTVALNLEQTKNFTEN